MDRNETINALKAALKARSGKNWSVTGGRGTAYGWIRASAPPRRCGEFGGTAADDAVELGQLFQLDGPAHNQGISIPASSAHRREHLARVKGEAFTVAEPYWD